MQIKTKKLTLTAILAALALIIFIVEAQFPLPVPVPGVKLGLANAVTLFALFYKTGKDSSHAQNDRKDSSHAQNDTEDSSHAQNDTEDSSHAQNDNSVNAFVVLFLRIVLGAVFTGRVVAFVYSLTGGVLGFGAQVLMKRFVSRKQIWVCGAVGGVFHNIGQIVAAVVVTGTPAIMVYLPVLVIAGILTGVITGLVAQFAVERLRIINKL